MGKDKTNLTLPSPPGRAEENVIRKRPGVSFSSQSRSSSGLPSIPRLPPNTNVSDPAFHAGLYHSPFLHRYLSPAELHDKSMREHPLLFASAPCFGDLEVRDVADNKLADGAGMFPFHFPLLAILSYDWRAGIAVPPSILRVSFPRCRTSLSLRFMEILDRLDLPLTYTLIPTSIGCDTCKFRTERERDYLDSLLSWTRSNPVVEADRLWRNQLTATNNAISWTCAIPSLDFLPFFQHTVRFERKIRSDTGNFLAY